jgi:hypothetical protein
MVDAGRLETALMTLATSSRDFGSDVRPRPVPIRKIMNFGRLSELRLQRQLDLLAAGERLRPVSLVGFRLRDQIVAYGIEDGRHRTAALARMGRHWVSARVKGEWIIRRS